MNAKPNLTSNATKIKSLLAALTIVIGLHGALLWQLDELANSGAQIAMLAKGAPATGSDHTLLTPIDRIALEPVTIVARRESRISELRLASATKQAASSAVKAEMTVRAFEEMPLVCGSTTASATDADVSSGLGASVVGVRYCGDT